MEQKMFAFYIAEHELQNVTNCYKTSFVFARCLVKTLQILVFLAGLPWNREVIQVKKTPVFTRHFKLLVEKTLQKNIVFYIHSETL